MSVVASRQIVLDTETTGLSPKDGHRIIEIGAVEMINRRVTGNNFHVYINPQRPVDLEAVKVHGITDQFLADKPVFSEIVQDFIDFVHGAELIIHNAPFDIGFINAEYSYLGSKFGVIENYCSVFDTLALARERHPGQRNSLDALCKRYEVDNSERDLHGALLDAEILADLYLAMTGGQASLLHEANPVSIITEEQRIQRLSDNRPKLKIISCNEIEQTEHLQRLAAIDKASGGKCLWH